MTCALAASNRETSRSDVRVCGEPAAEPSASRESVLCRSNAHDQGEESEARCEAQELTSAIDLHCVQYSLGSSAARRGAGRVSGIDPSWNTEFAWEKLGLPRATSRGAPPRRPPAPPIGLRMARQRSNTRAIAGFDARATTLLASTPHSVPEWRNWQTRRTQNPELRKQRAGSTPASGTIE